MSETACALPCPPVPSRALPRGALLLPSPHVFFCWPRLPRLPRLPGGPTCAWPPLAPRCSSLLLTAPHCSSLLLLPADMTSSALSWTAAEARATSWTRSDMCRARDWRHVPANVLLGHTSRGPFAMLFDMADHAYKTPYRSTPCLSTTCPFGL
ncbi:hypothetical protein BS50DRAFT_149330 [Corynespora cassiicola Philippines]|uniref:Uncharacterized protein n=1 Tax=Corynespora cassiicola Philippines TaxID=1448308 RepID=A0A2T2N7E2_CORCC|nr:hypothetical protein BS50DRAFT_149330 [Corynespora cassiicola Philippines]